MVLLSFFTEYCIIKLGLDGTALVNAFIPKIEIKSKNEGKDK